MTTLRRPVIFWLTSVVAFATVLSFDTVIGHNLEPDFGGPLGNVLITTLGVYALISVPPAFSHSFAAFLLRRLLTNSSTTSVFLSSALSGVVFPALLYLQHSLPIDFPIVLLRVPLLVPLLNALIIPCALAFLESLAVLAGTGLLRTKRSLGAA